MSGSQLMSESVPGQSLNNDLRLVVMAAMAFNMGIAPKPDRSPDAVDALTDACVHVGLFCGLEIDE